MKTLKLPLQKTSETSQTLRSFRKQDPLDGIQIHERTEKIHTKNTSATRGYSVLQETVYLKRHESEQTKSHHETEVQVTVVRAKRAK